MRVPRPCLAPYARQGGDFDFELGLAGNRLQSDAICTGVSIGFHAGGT